MLLLTYGHPKLLLASLLASSGVLAFMGEAKNLLREFIFTCVSPLRLIPEQLYYICLVSFPLYTLCRLTAITQLAHHGMLFVPLGYTFGSGMFEMNEVKGGSSYGAGTYAADGTREPTELELQQAFHQGKYVAEITKKLTN